MNPLHTNYQICWTGFNYSRNESEFLAIADYGTEEIRLTDTGVPYLHYTGSENRSTMIIIDSISDVIYIPSADRQ